MFLDIAGMYQMINFNLELGYNVMERAEQIVSLQTGVVISEVFGRSEGKILQQDKPQGLYAYCLLLTAVICCKLKLQFRLKTMNIVLL